MDGEMKPVTNKEIAFKLDNLLEQVKEHREEFREHIKLDAETKIEVVKLVTIEEGRRWQIRTLWGATAAALTGVAARFIWPNS